MTIGIGILGFAHGHVDAYCKQWAAQPRERVTVVAGWDHDAARLEKAKAAHGVALTASAAELLARRDVQAVVISAETSLHAELVEQAAAAGKAIILQKPLCLTLEQAERIVATVEKAKTPFTLAWQMRVDEQNLEIKELIRQGAIGKPYMLRRRHGLPTHSWGDWFADSWHVKKELNLGMWADDASHPIDFVYWLLGEAATVSAEIDTLHNPKVPDDHGIAIFRYPNGMMAEVVCSFVCLAGENTTEVVGSEGVIIQNYGDVPSCNVPRPEGLAGLKWYSGKDKTWHQGKAASPANHGQRISDLAEPLLQFLEGRRGPIATAADGAAALRMTLACYDSARLGRRVRVKDGQPSDQETDASGKTETIRR